MGSVVNARQAAAWNGYDGVHRAENQDRYDAMVGAWNGHLFETAAIGARDRVLDIGCGTGQTTRVAARQAPRGHAVGIDLSAPMLERARRTTAAEGVTNVAFEQGDAQVHPFPNGGFDVAVSRGGVMYFADPVAAFTNIGRALRPGGRLVFGCGRATSGGEPNEMSAVFAAMGAHLPQPEPAGEHEPGPVDFTDGDRIREVLTAAGFPEVTATPLELPMVFGRDAADAAGFIFEWGPVRFWLRAADEASVGLARDAAMAALRPYEEAGAVRLPTPVWLFSTTRP